MTESIAPTPPVAQPPIRVAPRHSQVSLMHSGMTASRFVGMHAMGAIFPITAGMMLFGWRAVATMVMVLFATAVAHIIWKRIGSRGVVPSQVGAEHAAHQLVDPKALTVLVEGNHRDVPVADAGEHAGRAVLVEDRVAERRGKLPEDRRPLQERSLRRRERVEALGPEVLAQRPGLRDPVAGRRGASVGAKRRRGEREPGGPALRLLEQRVELRRRERDPEAFQRGPCFAARQDEVARTELQELSARA